MHPERHDNNTAAVLGGIGLGAALMYFLDPSRGRRRRSLARDQMTHALRRSESGMQATVHDLNNRAHGIAARARNAFRHEDPSDDVLVARVRSELGRVCSHPRALIVTADAGRVIVSGPILEREVDHVLDAIRGVRGVDDVTNQLEVHGAPSNVPSLQGGTERPGTTPELMQEQWTPAFRFLAGAAGATLAGYGFSKKGTAGALAGIAGAALFTRSITNSGPGAARTAARASGTIHKTITVAAPIDEVYRFFSDYQNFPAFMTHVRDVEDRGDGRSHWTVDGPAGTHVSWEAELTEEEPNRVIAWQSLPGATVDNAGRMTFESLPDGGTRMNLELRHSPPAGALGSAVAALFRRDPKHQLDDDLVRAKTFLETGHPPRDAARPVSPVRNLPAPSQA